MDGHLEPLLRELVGAALREERTRQRRTLAQVADAAGISMQHLSDVERGREDPSSELLAAITGALALTVPDLLLRVADGAAVTGLAAAEPVRLELSSLSGPGRRQIRFDGDGRTAGAGLTVLSAA
ncbi:helix-turn-helix domain-containing protein [Brachybacterium sp. GCM10030268]|uniref:helix-turn-helix domain-containing protein n=1 Tax=Brachybacterium sp. GCM10030268 TaxID=3273382 RepID=UPI00360BA380